MITPRTMKSSRFGARQQHRKLGIEPLERRDLLATYPTVVINTNVGDIPIEMYDDTAPLTVSNFLKYVEDGAYTNAIFHRIIEEFVVQGGGFRSSNEVICTCSMQEFSPTQVDPSLFSEIPTNPPVVNEFQRSNVEGTVAMAKLGGDPNSATNQFFFNLDDNSNNLDNQNGGFTVFAGILDNSVVKKIEAGRVANLSGIFPAGSRLGALASTAIFSNAELDNVRVVRMESFSGTAVISGTVFLDLNKDGVRNAGDGGIANSQVFLDLNRDGIHNPNEPITTADALGAFEFQAPAGEHHLRVVPMADYDYTSGDEVDSEALIVHARIGRRFTNQDFGFTYSGTSWHNSRLPSDVDGMNGTVPLDALLAVNELSQRQFSNPETGALPPRTTPPSPPRFLDVDNNSIFSPLDALLVINNLPSSNSATDEGGSRSQGAGVIPQAPLSLPLGAGFHGSSRSLSEHSKETDEERCLAIDGIFADGLE